MAAGGVTEAANVQEMEQQILKLIPKLQLKIGEIQQFVEMLATRLWYKVKGQSM